MTVYQAPVDDMNFVLNELAQLPEFAQAAALEDVNEEIVTAILDEASKLANQVLAPINRLGDEEGVHLDSNGDVIAPPAFVQAYQQYVESGWGSLPFPEQWGGQNMPFTLSVAVQEMWHAANLAWGLCPLLSQGAVEAINTNASDALKERYLPNMVSGEWTGTMNLTEPQAGSDLSDIRTRAVPEEDHYRITGQKIFITWGDHNMAENVVHLVLARLPDAPSGVRGISLFLVPKYLVNEDGTLGERNDCSAFSLEEKLGIHASPTCVMSFDGAIGYLVGEENNGLACMFTMMNNARLTVGLQGVAVAERAYQHGLSYAYEREQGIAPNETTRGAIAKHPDVYRMLMTMKALTEAARALTYVGCMAVDWSHSEQDADGRYQRRAALLTPIIKGWATDIAQEVTSLNIQCHGGMGFIEETGAAQLYRDARILPIYEGTNGIQAIDLVGRKTIYDQGKAMDELLSDVQEGLAVMRDGDVVSSHHLEALVAAVDALQAGKDIILALADEPVERQGKAVAYMTLCGIVLGGYYSLLGAHRSGLDKNQAEAPFNQQKRATAAFYIDQILPRYLSYSALLNAPVATLTPAEILGAN